VGIVASDRFGCRIAAVMNRPLIAKMAALVRRASARSDAVSSGPLKARGEWLVTGRGTPHKPDVEEVAMLEGKTRISPVNVETLPDDLRETLEEQRKLSGAPLYPYLFYARNPAYFRAAKAMFAALQQETRRVPGTLRALLNRRVAWWNGCEF
jgi:hypothetical protein